MLAPAPRAARLVTAAWALLIGTSALYFLSSNQADNDLWGHVLFGRAFVAAGGVIRADPYSYTAAGAAWMDHEWLSQMLLYAAYALGGGPGLWMLKLTVGLAAFALALVRLTRRASSPWVWGIVALLLVAVLARGFAMRPQIFSYLGFAATLLIIDRHQRTGHGLSWMIPLMALWANLHGGFVLGLAALGLYTALHRTFDLRCWIVLGAAVLATAINPFGWRLLTYVVGELTVEHPITEWQSAALGDVSQATFFVMAALFALTLPFASWRERPWEVLLALGAAAMAIRHQRHTPVFALAAAAPLTAQLAAAARWAPWRPRPLSRGAQYSLAIGLILLAVAQLAVQGSRLIGDRFQVTFDAGDYPVAAVQALSASDLTLNLAVPLDWGEYVLWHLAPRVKVSLDGRFATLFPPAVVDDNFAFFAGDPGWERLLTAYPTDAALIPRGAPCPVRRQPSWHKIYDDDVAEIYVNADRVSSLQLHPPSQQLTPRFP